MLRICKAGMESGNEGMGALLAITVGQAAAFEVVGRLPDRGANPPRLADPARPPQVQTLAIMPIQVRPSARSQRSVSRDATTIRRVNRRLQAKTDVSRFYDARY
jgi:hypothetical protein